MKTRISHPPTINWEAYGESTACPPKYPHETNRNHTKTQRNSPLTSDTHWQMGRDRVQPPRKLYSHTFASLHQVTCLLCWIAAACDSFDLFFMNSWHVGWTFDIKKKLTRNWIAVLIRQARRFRQKITKSNRILFWHHAADIPKYKTMHYIYLSSTTVASASIQFSQRHAFGEKKSWQRKDKQSKRNKVTDLEGRKVTEREKGR